MYPVTRELLGYFTVLPFDGVSADVYADIAGALRKNGTRISSFDELIAAIVIGQSDTLVTRDKHFNAIPGLQVRSY